MKITVILGLVGYALAAPTKTVENRQLDGWTSGSSSGGLVALASLFPGLSSLNSGSSSSSTGGLTLPSGLSLPSLGFGADSSLGGLSLPTDLSSLSSLGLGSTGSSTGGITFPSGLSIPGLESSGSSGLDFKAKRAVSSTASDVTDKKSCQPLTFIFARGSDEIGNMGTVVGPPVATQLQSLTGNKVLVQGVNYAATAEGNVALGSNGGPVMASLVKQALQQCPDTKVVLGGYSQGAMVVHNAANSLSAEQVAAAVLFGDPFKSQSVGKLVSSQVKEFCATGDPVCENGYNVMAHLTYGSDAQTAAQFLIQESGVSTSS